MPEPQHGRHADVAATEIDTAAGWVHTLTRHFPGDEHAALRADIEACALWVRDLQGVDRPADARLRLSDTGSHHQIRRHNGNRGSSWT